MPTYLRCRIMRLSSRARPAPHIVAPSRLAAASRRCGAALALALLCAAAPAHAQADDPGKPNILVIFGDDIGWQNVSAYGLGTMGYRTPNIDRIANEGAKFTDHYAQPSCTAGRAAFITGSYPIRSGMTTVGFPGDKLGLQPGTPTLADVLKSDGYRTGQFGKNHLGDNNPHLPTVHGFDEFFGNLYHLNTQEEGEQRDYQNWEKTLDPNLEKKYGTRGVLHCMATTTDDDTTDPRFGRVGKQKCEDTGALTRKRMENFDADEVIPRARQFMASASQTKKPFFVWLNTTRMHIYVRLPEKDRYLAENYTSEVDLHGSGMMQHDRDIGDLLKWMDENGLAKNTIVVYTTDNGPEHSTWPHGGTTPFRGEKLTSYEGGVRVPMMVRWPGHIPAGQTLNGIQAHEDIYATLAAAAGDTNVADRLKKQYKWYLDGMNNLAYWQGRQADSNRNFYIFYNEAEIFAVRYGAWKWHFQTKENYYDTVVKHATPLVFNIRMDPFESYSSTDAYGHLLQKVSWQFAPIRERLHEHIESLQQYPPRQGSNTFDMSRIIEDSLRHGQE
jgi:arylsulfatase A-like enzyme